LDRRRCPCDGLAGARRRDNNLVRFWIAVAATLAFDHAERPALLVIGDYHVIEQLAIHDTVLTLTERLPPQLRLVVASPADPALHLGRRAALLRAVTLGEPEGHVRSIIDAGPAIALLLRALAIIR
jgi:hypothetical protein